MFQTPSHPPSNHDKPGRTFLFHHGTLIKVYKANLADLLRECDLYDSSVTYRYRPSKTDT